MAEEELLSRSEKRFFFFSLLLYGTRAVLQCISAFSVLEAAHDCDVYVSGSKYTPPFNGKIIVLRFLCRLPLSVIANPGTKHKSSAKLLKQLKPFLFIFILHQLKII